MPARRAAVSSSATATLPSRGGGSGVVCIGCVTLAAARSGTEQRIIKAQEEKATIRGSIPVHVMTLVRDHMKMPGVGSIGVAGLTNPIT